MIEIICILFFYFLIFVAITFSIIGIIFIDLLIILIGLLCLFTAILLKYEFSLSVFFGKKH